MAPSSPPFHLLWLRIVGMLAKDLRHDAGDDAPGARGSEDSLVYDTTLHTLKNMIMGMSDPADNIFDRASRASGWRRGSMITTLGGSACARHSARHPAGR